MDPYCLVFCYNNCKNLNHFNFIGRFGRRKILLVSFLVAAVGAIGALLLSDKAEYDKGTF